MNECPNRFQIQKGWKQIHPTLGAIFRCFFPHGKKNIQQWAPKMVSKILEPPKIHLGCFPRKKSTQFAEGQICVCLKYPILRHIQEYNLFFNTNIWKIIQFFLFKRAISQAPKSQNFQKNLPLSSTNWLQTTTIPVGFFVEKKIQKQHGSPAKR